MRFFALFSLVLMLPLSAFAGVNLKNGNFYITYTDIIVPGDGNDLSVVRTYNSKSTEKGWFGFGWGSDFETFLTVAPDMSVTVHENGAGALTRFVPDGNIDAGAAADKIIEAMRKRTTITDKVASDLKSKLVGDAELRQAYSRRFNVTVKIADGTVLHSNVRGIQTLHKVKDGFRRDYNDGKSEFFSEDGKLTKITDKNGYVVDLNYDKNKLVSIKDSMAKQLFFDWYADGRIKEVWSAGDKKTSYKFKNDNLVESVDISGNKYAYDYDSNHNMTAIKYADGSQMTIKYTDKTQFVSEVVDRNGVSTGYKYESNAKNPEHHYWTFVTKKTASGKPQTNKYEYETKVKADGSQYTYRILTEINGVTTETVYSECCSLPEKITRGSDVTNFEYNSKGLLVKKVSSKGDFVNLEYHDKFNKITKVVNPQGTTSYEYDQKGNLSRAVNSDGKSVLLVYDRNGRITKMIDQDNKTKERRTLEFKYNPLGKPIEITMDKVGKINVAYDNYGEIQKVESQSGHKMALQVTQAFQSLLSIVKPAGVNLNM
jgi:YD repeat-containing protein